MGVIFSFMISLSISVFDQTCGGYGIGPEISLLFGDRRGCSLKHRHRAIARRTSKNSAINEPITIPAIAPALNLWFGVSPIIIAGATEIDVEDDVDAVEIAGEEFACDVGDDDIAVELCDATIRMFKGCDSLAERLGELADTVAATFVSILDRGGVPLISMDEASYDSHDAEDEISTLIARPDWLNNDGDRK